jgi:ribose-phosphate pyrophosphokinase
MILSGRHSQSIAAELAERLDEPLAPVAFDRFPDGELMASIGDVTPADGERAIVVASTPSSDAHIELLQLQDAAHEAGFGEVITVVPYLGYARQDQAFEQGEPVSVRAVARAISTGADRVLTIDPHEEDVCDFFDPPATPISAAARLAEPLPDDLTDPLFLSPDAGAIDLAETVQEAAGTGTVDYFEKKRHSGSEVEISPSDTSVDGRDVVVIDDIIATGSTMSEALSILQERGANRVFVTCIHPLLAGNAVTKLSRAGVDAVYGTDTIERPCSAVSAAPVVVDALADQF